MHQSGRLERTSYDVKNVSAIFESEHVLLLTEKLNTMKWNFSGC